MRATIKIMCFLQLLSSAAAISCDESESTRCVMRSVKVYSDTSCQKFTGEKKFDDSNKHAGYGTGCHTIGSRSAWIAFVCGQVEA
jgi:hypothetical protein